MQIDVFLSHLLDVTSNGFAVQNIIEIQCLRSTSHCLDLHLQWHICILYQTFAFQHLSSKLISLSLKLKVSRAHRGISPVLIFLLFKEYTRMKREKKLRDFD